MPKILIIRFSSFGDIAFLMPAVSTLRKHYPNAEIHWLTRSDFSEFVSTCKSVDRVISFHRKNGLRGLLNLTQNLKQENYTHIYDAHANLRSKLVSFILRFHQNFKVQFIRRSKERCLRILLFWFRINLFPQPYKGVESFIAPIEPWLNKKLPRSTYTELNLDQPLQMLPIGYDISQAIILAPSATWELKRWPQNYWIKLAQLLPDQNFVLVAGNDDLFCDDISSACKNILNLRGKLSWVMSANLISHAKAVISGDTGILHVADILKVPAVAILGPSAFGHPTNDTSVVAQVDLSCRPCTKDGRGHCTNSVYKKCLDDVKPEMIVQKLNEIGVL